MRKVKWPHWGLNEDKSSAESIWESGGRNSEANSGERNAVDWARASGACARRLVGLGVDKAPGVIVLERTAWPQEPLQSMLAPRPPWDEAYGVVKMAGNSGKESSGSVFGGRSSGVTRTSSIVSGGGGGGGIISGTLRNWGRSKSLTDSSNAKNERQSKGILGSATAAAVVAVTVGTAPVPERTEAENYSDNDDDNDNKSNNSSSSASSSSGSSSGSSSRGSSRSGRNNLPGAVKPSITRSSSARLKQPPPNSKLTPRSLAQKSRDSASFSQSKDSIGSSSSSTSSGKNSRSQNRSQSPRHRNLRTSSEVTNSNTTRKLPPPPKRMTSLRKRTNQKVQSQPLKRGPSFNTGGPFRTVR